MEKLTFKLIHKDYAREYYESNVFIYEGKSVKALVRMRYHTIRHYWHVVLYFVYGENFKYCTSNIDGKSYIKYRKDARKLAETIMDNTTTLTLHKVSEFHLNHIKVN